jgi:hypothetical protein
MVHQSPFEGVNQWGTPFVAHVFTPSLYILLQAITFTPIYTMEVNNSTRKIEKFSERPGTIFLKEFKATFSITVCELELKYGANYTKMFTLKRLVCYVHYEALDVYEQHSPRILGITQIPNTAYATTITTASQATLLIAIAHHETVPNNPDLVPTSINLSLQELIIAIANISPTINVPAFANPMGEFFRVLELEFLIKNFEKLCNHLFSAKG